MRMKRIAVTMAMCVSVFAAGCGGKKAETGEEQTKQTVQESSGTETGTENKMETETETESSAAGREESSGGEETQQWIAGDYIFPDSDVRLLTDEEIKSVPPEFLRFARNEIFARHGRMFTSAELQEYFWGKEWYKGRIQPEDFSDNMLNAVEKENIKLIKAREDLGELPDSAKIYKKIMDDNEIFGWNGLLENGYITASLGGNYTDYYPVLEDRGGYYAVPKQVLSVPVYYQWDYIKNVKTGDKLTLSFGMLTERLEYTVTDIVQELEKEAKIISVKAPGQDEIQLVFTDVFDNGKYALAIVDWIEGDGYVIWNSDDISCACDVLYDGYFYLSKDCIIDVAGELRSVEDQRETDWERNPFGGAIYGNIIEVDENGLITYIRQQVAG